MTGLPAKLALAVVALLTSLAALEFAARFAVPLTRVPANPLYVPHPHLVFTGNPDRNHTSDGFTGPDGSCRLRGRLDDVWRGQLAEPA